MTQPPLFATPSPDHGVSHYGNALPPFQKHSETSREAAIAIAPKLNALQGKVLRYLKGKGSLGSTDEDGIAFLSMSPSTYRPRRIELVDMGLVKDSGRTREVRSGRSAVIWTVVK